MYWDCNHHYNTINIINDSHKSLTKYHGVVIVVTGSEKIRHIRRVYYYGYGRFQRRGSYFMKTEILTEVNRLTFYLCRTGVIDISLRQKGQNKPKPATMLGEVSVHDDSVRSWLL